MKKYGKFFIIPLGYDIFVVAVEYADFVMTFKAGGINEWGTSIKIVRTLDKAFRTAWNYERRMGR